MNDKFLEVLEEDEFYKKASLALKEEIIQPKWIDYRLTNEGILLYFKDRVYILEVKLVRNRIMHEFHVLPYT